jgi:hypothetical protein
MNERQAQQRPAPTDPSGIEAPHDVLAAEEFGIGTRDERWPADPTGIAEPHDVLAAEEFAMPVGESPQAADEGGRGSRRLPLVLAAAAGLLLALLVLRRTARG